MISLRKAWKIVLQPKMHQSQHSHFYRYKLFIHHCKHQRNTLKCIDISKINIAEIIMLWQQQWTIWLVMSFKHTRIWPGFEWRFWTIWVVIDDLYLEPLRPIFFRLEKYRQNFLKFKHRGPPVRGMPRYELEAIQLLFIDFSRKGSTYSL